jgi:X-Pro dipeptidyl-peptidase (S15 family)
MRLLALATLLTLTLSTLAQGPRQQLTPEQTKALIEKRAAIERQLEDIAIIDRKVMVPMKDGARMAADIYRPKDTTKKYPIIFSRTPYNFNFWDVKLGGYRDMTTELDAVKRGYILVEMNERGHFFSEGNYDILGAPLSDADDQFTWMADRPHRLFLHGRVAARSRLSRQQGPDHHHPAELRRRRRQGRPLQRARQLVPWWRRSDALHRLALRRAESSPPHVP